MASDGGGKSIALVVLFHKTLKLMKSKFTTVFAALQLVVLVTFAQSTNLVTGTITDEKGEPLPFATVLLGNGESAVADFDGHFSVEIPAEEAGMEMTASSTGYTPQTALWTNDNLGNPMKLRLATGIDLPVVEIIYTKPLIEYDICSCCCSRIDCFTLKPSTQPSFDKEKKEKFEVNNTAVYPNPFTTTLNVEMEVMAAQTYRFDLFNEAGLLVFAESRELSAGLQTFQLDLAQRHLPEGIYFFRISDDVGEKRTKRLVKVSP
jgi:hypothetical protein